MLRNIWIEALADTNTDLENAKKEAKRVVTQLEQANEKLRQQLAEAEAEIAKRDGRKKAVAVVKDVISNV